LSGFYTYAPLGKLLKNNVEETIRKVFQRNDFWEVEVPIVTPAKVWEASGHLGNFTDPLIKDVEGGIYRADHLIEEHYNNKGEDPATILAKNPGSEGMLKIIKENNITANGKELIQKIENHNLMMQTTVGLEAEAYNRPETATTTYLPFTRYFDFFRKKLPFGVFQIGKAFRNEISPRQFTLRMREFTQAEAQLFIYKDQKNDFALYNKYKNTKLPFWPWDLQEKDSPAMYMTLEEARTKFLKNDAYAYTLALTYELFTAVGIPPTSMRLRQHGPKEKAFYAEDAWDIEVKLKSFGWMEMCGVHDRTDYDLKQHAKHSKKELGVSDETHKKEVPHV
ncbi:glycine--tRNA ligase, partial [Candidatus Woesearchaeota archaeon]|nr:glycine--tRNA ligase [Candidatus Woesearchaeota archaeon]